LAEVAFPLTPALSRGERENGRRRFDKPGVLWLFETLAAILPLPAGEAWGENSPKEDFVL